MSRNGWRVRVRRIDGAPVVALSAWMRGGARVEPCAGAALLTGRLLTEGTLERSWEEIATAAEDRGMALAGAAGYDATAVTVDALAEDWEPALELLAELVREPRFPADRLAWTRRQMLAELESWRDQPETRTGLAFQEQLYRSHPYGRPLHGDEESLSRIEPEDCCAYHLASQGWGGAVIVCGDLPERDAERRAHALFSGLPPGEGEPLPEVTAPAKTVAGRQEVGLGAGDQAHLYVGHLTVPRSHPDLAALDILAVILGAGAGLGGRLPSRVRERLGLAYSVDVATTAGAGVDPGRLAVYVGTSQANAHRAEAAVREEIARLVADGISEDELEEARAYLLGREPFRRETARQWAELIAEGELYGYPAERSKWSVERYRRLSRTGVEAAARRWIDADRLQVTLGMPGGRSPRATAGRPSPPDRRRNR